MRSTKKQTPTAQPGLWPTDELVDGLEKSILYVRPESGSTVEHVNRFLEYLEMAEPGKAIAVLVKLYFDYSLTSGVPPLFNAEQLDEFAHLAKFFADMAATEGEYLADDRSQLLEALYYNAKPGGDDDEKE